MQVQPPDQTLEYLKLAGTFLGGGLAGAAVTNIVTVYRNRVQPVRYKVETSPIFTGSMPGRSVDAKVTLTEEGKDYAFDNLFLMEMIVTNTGNQNIKEFTIGLTVEGATQMVSVTCTPPDRHHSGTTAKAASPAAPSLEVDYVLKPFNRRDAYQFRILATCSTGTQPSKITPSSSESVRFVSSPGFLEALEAEGYTDVTLTALKIVARLGGIRF